MPGPVPGLGLQPNYSLTLAAIIVADNVATYALASSIWTSTFALGAFLGPTTGAASTTWWSTLFLVAWNVVVATEAEEDTEGSLPGDNQSGGGGGGGTPAAVMSEHLELKKTVLITVYTK